MTEEKMIPRPEYPRPQMVRCDWINLNGEWEFERDFGNSGVQRKLHLSECLSEKITVPFCMESPLSGVGYKDFCSSVWYRRAVSLPDGWLDGNSRVILNIGASDYLTHVYVNGNLAGKHRGGSTPISLDIRDFLTPGENVIVINAVDETRSGEQPLGKQSKRYSSYGCVYTRTTGIWQTVWLERVPCAYIKSTKYITDVAASSVTVEVKSVSPDGTPFTAEAFWDGKKVGEATAVTSYGNAVVNVKLSELHLWELGKGGLYSLVLTLGEDRVESYFGMRELSLDNGALVINGKKVFQRTVLDQGFYPDGIWTAPCEQALIDDITRSMDCGFNGARLHQKVFEPIFLYHCDRLGYMVWGEFGNWGLDVSRPAAWSAMFIEWSDVLERDINHPSIIGWCPFNETQANRDSELLSSIVDLTKRIDPTRPVIDTSGWYHVRGSFDILDFHDYDQDPDSVRQRYEDYAGGIVIKRLSPEGTLGVPLFISEYGGIKWDINSNNSSAWGYGNAPTTEEEYLSRFKGLTEALMFNPMITGICYTQLTDVEQETNGIYTYDRKEKFPSSFFRSVLTQKAAIEE